MPNFKNKEIYLQEGHLYSISSLSFQNDGALVCSGEGNEDNHNCNQCNEFLYKYTDTTTSPNKIQCLSNCPNGSYPYSDPILGLICKSCNSHCLTCLGEGTDDNHNCTKCKSGLYFA